MAGVPCSALVTSDLEPVDVRAIVGARYAPEVSSLHQKAAVVVAVCGDCTHALNLGTHREYELSLWKETEKNGLTLDDAVQLFNTLRSALLRTPTCSNGVVAKSLDTLVRFLLRCNIHRAMDHLPVILLMQWIPLDILVQHPSFAYASQHTLATIPAIRDTSKDTVREAATTLIRGLLVAHIE